MTERTFVDTNVWVYAVDGADPAKQARAIERTIAPRAQIRREQNFAKHVVIQSGSRHVRCLRVDATPRCEAQPELRRRRVPHD